MPVPIISVAQMREWETASWAAGRSEADVIGQVGRLVAQRALRLTRAGERILILAGKGHNGDDVRESRPHLLERDVIVVNVTEPDAALAEIDRELRKRPALAIDGLFGIGLNRPLDTVWIKLIERVNAANLPVLAVDVPSGLNAETGEIMGATIRAAITLTIGAPKRGCFAANAIPWIGRLEVAPDIGLIPCAQSSELQWMTAEDFRGFPPPRAVNTHKGSFGHLVILAGSIGYHGAAVLAARGAQRACPGLLTIITPENVYLPVASQLQAAMVLPWHAGMALPATCSAIVIGPGLAARELPAELHDEVRQIWSHSPLPVVVDASALDWLPPGARSSTALRVLTPHPGEAARLLGVTTAQVQSDRARALRELSRRFGDAWVVLKGHQTLIGRGSGEIFVNSSGNPFLAQGGSGDVLAGFLGGLLAQPALQTDPSTAIRFAVFEHGAAADRLVEHSGICTIDELVSVLAGTPELRLNR
ncbi:MAG: NAD(P)H-hydrate dehydratase [Verrucomicrobia bacterium]|nr:NAD(P)H-hydrate dehydratase [Verrucomicrobiota bacterium]